MKKIIVAGTQDILNNCLEVLFLSKVQVLIVYTSKANEEKLRDFANQKKLHFKIKTIDLKADVDYLRTIKPDLLFSFQYGYLVNQQVLDIFQGRCFNLHFSLLPKYAGCYPITWAILNGETKTGVSLHVMTDRFDDGDIVAQKMVTIDSNMTGEELYRVQTKAAASLFSGELSNILEGKVKPKKQNANQFLYYKNDSIDWKRDLYIDWDKDIRAVHNQIRAFTFPQFQLPKTFLNGVEVTISGSEIADQKILNDPSFQRFSESKHSNQLIGVYQNKAAVWKDRQILLIRKLQNMDASRFLNENGFNLVDAHFRHQLPKSKQVSI